MATISTIAIDGIALPGDATVVNVLASVYDLSKRVGVGSATCLALHGRLLAIRHELEETEARGALQRESITLFTRTLDEYWRHLDAYVTMTTVERLLRHRKWQRTIASVHEHVDELSRMIGLATSGADWRLQLEIGMDAQLAELVVIVQDTNELLDEIRGVRDQQDATVLLKHALEQIKAGTSTLPVGAHAAVRSALHTIVSATIVVVEPTQCWFLSEADVAFTEKPFARGSFSTVHRAHVGAVVKMLLPDERGLDANLQQSLVAEASVWHSMRHPHVVQLLGACHVTSRPFLLCEDAENGSLNDYLNREPTHRQHVWRLLHEAAQGLAYLHAKGVVHGDVRLSNVLVTRDQTAVLTDFGLSRIKNKAKGESVVRRRGGGVVRGNWRWRAPETYTHIPQPASDVYALAMTTLEAFTGEPPYAGVRDESDVKAKVSKGELPARPRGMTDRAWQLILDMTRRAPHERVSLDHVVDRLCEFEANEPPPPPWVLVDTSDTATPVHVPQPPAVRQRSISDTETISTPTLPRVPLLLSAASIRAVVDKLEDTVDLLAKEQLVTDLAAIAQHERGAQLIGARGGVTVLVRLLSDRSERLRRSALLALTQLVAEPLNAAMFVRADGLTGLASHLTSSSRRGRVEALTQLSETVANREPIADALASHRTLLPACLDVLKSEYADERDTAAQVLEHLVRRSASAVRAIHSTGGFAAMLELARKHNSEVIDDIVLAAIDTLVRAPRGHAPSHGEPRAGRTIRVAA